MNSKILTSEIQSYINSHLEQEVTKIALSKSPFEGVAMNEIAAQIISKKKAKLKLPTWFSQENIYYPSLLSMEQCSSEHTAMYKAKLAVGTSLLDLTAGFGVDSYFFAKEVDQVISCEINAELAEISSNNAGQFGAKNIRCLGLDGISFLKQIDQQFGTIYIDPARRSENKKVFMLKDCTPDVTQHLDLFLAKADRIIIKTAPLLDISAGLKELRNVSEIHILSVKNECKELLWIIDKIQAKPTKIFGATINDQIKTLAIPLNEKCTPNLSTEIPTGYLYEPDVALLKSGAFNWIGNHYKLEKIHAQSHLYTAPTINSEFLGRIFKIDQVLSLNELKKESGLTGNVIVRNFPERAENLVRKFKIKSSQNEFIIFTQSTKGFHAIKATIIQHY